jgi:hypothetical protein
MMTLKKIFIAEGDALFHQEFDKPLEEREPFDMEGKVQQTIHFCIENLLHDEIFEDAGMKSDEDEGGGNEGVNDDEEEEEEKESKQHKEEEEE